MSNAKRTVCDSGLREAFLPPLPGAKLHIRNYHVPLCTILKVKELESQLSRRIKSPPPPLPIRLSIKKGSGFSTKMPCDKEFAGRACRVCESKQMENFLKLNRVKHSSSQLTLNLITKST